MFLEPLDREIIEIYHLLYFLYTYIYIHTHAHGSGCSAHIHEKPSAIYLKDGFPVVRSACIFQITVLNAVFLKSHSKSSKCFMTSSR